MVRVVVEWEGRLGRRSEDLPPVGSELGKMSLPQILQAATPVTIAAKAKKGAWMDREAG